MPEYSSAVRARAEALVAEVHEQIFQAVAYGGQPYIATMSREMTAACARWRETEDADTRALAIELGHRGVALQERIIAAAEGQTDLETQRHGSLGRDFG